MLRIISDPALAYVFLIQICRHVSRNILKVNTIPHDIVNISYVVYLKILAIKLLFSNDITCKFTLTYRLLVIKT